MIYKEEKFMCYLQMKDMAASNRKMVLQSLERFSEWCKHENNHLTEANYNDILGYVHVLKEKGNKPVTVLRNISNLKHYYTFLMQEDDIADNPCSNIAIKGVQRKYLYKTYSREELEKIYQTFINTPQSNYKYAEILHRQHKVIFGLIIYQALRVDEINRLKLENLQLREGKIEIISTKRTAGRILQLEAHQLYELMDYVHQTRKEIQSKREKQGAIMPKEMDKDQLFISPFTSGKVNYMINGIRHKLHKQCPQIKDLKQIRGSVISNWLKEFDLRKVQYLAGHKYVSSTEAYKVNNLEDLKEEVNRYHPDF